MRGSDSTSGRRTDVVPKEHVPGEVKFPVCVDRRPQSRVAGRLACRRAKNTGGRVSSLHVIEPPEFQHWMAVVNVLVVGTAPPMEQSFSLITFLAGRLVGNLSIPLVIGPGNPSDEEIVNLT